jgi:hypothetical protein
MSTGSAGATKICMISEYKTGSGMHAWQKYRFDTMNVLAKPKNAFKKSPK